MEIKEIEFNELRELNLSFNNVSLSNQHIIEF